MTKEIRLEGKKVATKKQGYAISDQPLFWRKKGAHSRTVHNLGIHGVGGEIKKRNRGTSPI